MSPEELKTALEFYGDPDSYTGHEQQVLMAAREWLEAIEVESVGVTFDEMPEGYDGLIVPVPSREWRGPIKVRIVGVGFDTP